MLIAVTGEGPTDIGKIDYITGNFSEGPVLTLVRRILPNVAIDFVHWDRKNRDKKDKQRGFRMQGRTGKLSGHGKLAYIFKQFANSEEADAAIYYSDSDRISGSDARKESVCQKRYDDLKREIFKGFDAADIQGKTFVCSGVAAIPVKMIESWLLADKNAFDMAFGVRTCKDFPKYPELEWGDIDDINSNYSKNKMDRILECYVKIGIGKNVKAEKFFCNY